MTTTVASMIAPDVLERDERLALIQRLSDRLGLRIAIIAKEDSPPENSPHRFGPLYIDFENKYVEAYGSPVRLSRTEFRLLVALARGNGNVISTDDLHREVFNTDKPDDSRYIRMYIWLLRKRIEKYPKRPRIILNAWGRGYRLAFPVNPTANFNSEEVFPERPQIAHD